MCHSRNHNIIMQPEIAPALLIVLNIVLIFREPVKGPCSSVDSYRLPATHAYTIEELPQTPLPAPDSQPSSVSLCAEQKFSIFDNSNIKPIEDPDSPTLFVIVNHARHVSGPNKLFDFLTNVPIFELRFFS